MSKQPVMKSTNKKVAPLKLISSWWCCQPYHQKPVRQENSHDPNRCLVTVPYCVDFCWGPEHFFFGTDDEAIKEHSKLVAKEEEERSSGKRLSQRVDALPGETEGEYDARVKALDDQMRKECGGKTYDEITDEQFERGLAALK